MRRIDVALTVTVLALGSTTPAGAVQTVQWNQPAFGNFASDSSWDDTAFGEPQCGLGTCTAPGDGDTALFGTYTTTNSNPVTVNFYTDQQTGQVRIFEGDYTFNFANPGTTFELNASSRSLVVGGGEGSGSSGEPARLTLSSGGGAPSIFKTRWTDIGDGDGPRQVASGVVRLEDPDVYWESSSLINVGRDGGTGQLYIDNSTARIITSRGHDLRIGRNGGQGRVDLTNGAVFEIFDTEVPNEANGPNVSVGLDFDGEDGGSGVLNVIDSTLTVDSVNNDARMFVGRSVGADGAAVLDGAGTQVSVRSDTSAGVTVGGSDNAVGNLDVSNGATLTIHGDKDAFFVIGFREHAQGTVSINGGGQVYVTSDVEDGDVLIGAAWDTISDFTGQPTINLHGGKGRLTVTGENSLLHAKEQVFVGAPIHVNGISGDGILTVEDGGRISSPMVWIGVDGVLTGDGGTIDGDLKLDGGTVAPGASPGILNITGDFEILSGVLDIEIAGANQHDVINVAGDVIADEAFTLQLTFLDGYVPAHGEAFDFLEVDGDSSSLQTLLALGMVDVDLIGLGVEYQADVAFDGSVLSAQVAPVPLPAMAPMFVLGLGLVGAYRRWGRRRA